MDITIKSAARGILSYIPGVSHFVARQTGGTVSARYCYAVWLRHLVMAHQSGLSTAFNIVAELGPGNSLGVGLAALLSGASKYFAFDIVRYATNTGNIRIFEELVSLFKRHEKIPDEKEFPEIRPHLETYNFPDNILTDERLSAALAKERIELIKKILINLGSDIKGELQISYCVPWHETKAIQEASVDMIYSQAVLEHVNNLADTYNTLYRWLKPGGFMSHEIDFGSHGLSKQWNGHWACSDFVWKLVKGRRPYLLNREPHSRHINFMEQAGFTVMCDIKDNGSHGIQRKSLAPRFKNISDEDLVTKATFIQAAKK